MQQETTAEKVESRWEDGVDTGNREGGKANDREGNWCFLCQERTDPV